MLPKLTIREAFLEAFIHRREPYALLGRRLRPFCLHHWMLLDAAGSPLLRGGRITMEDFRLAALVCSTRTSAEFDRLRLHGLRHRLWLRFYGNTKPEDWLPVWNHYFEDYLPEFPMWPSDKDPDGKVPGFFVAAARLLGPMDEEAVLALPLGKLVAWGLAKAEAEGHILDRLMSDADFESFREVLRLRAEAAKQSPQSPTPEPPPERGLHG